MQILIMMMKKMMMLRFLRFAGNIFRELEIYSSHVKHVK